jgi:hypothetical protein
MAFKIRRVLRAIELAGSSDRLAEALKSPDARDVAIELIATENHLPRFVAARLYDHVTDRLSSSE